TTIAAWYVVFLLCLWDVESMVLITPPGGETLALRVFNLLHYGHNAQVNALCLTLLAVAVAPLVLWQAATLFLKSQVRTRSVAGMGAAGTAGLWLFTCCVCLALTGCGVKSGENETALDSKIFSRVQIIGTRGTGVGELNKPRSVAVDKKDNVY